MIVPNSLDEKVFGDPKLFLCYRGFIGKPKRKSKRFFLINLLIDSKVNIVFAFIYQIIYFTNVFLSYLKKQS